MRQNMSGLLNPIKINHSSSFILPAGDHSGTYNKNTEKIKMLQLDLETSKDTIIKLRSELVQKNQEIKSLKFNNKDQKLEHQYTIKVIETVLRLIDPDIFNKKPKEKQSNTATYNTINHEINGKEEEDNKNTKGECEKELNINISNLNKKNMKPNSKIIRTERSPKKLTMLNYKLQKDFSYINSLQCKVNLLKELLIKKNNEIKEMQRTTNTENFSNLQDNFEKNYAEMETIKKQNELMKTKIEDMTNLLFMEKEGNKSLKSKLQIFQSNFKEYQENSEKKNVDLETKLFKAQEKERDCRIFHTRKATELDDGERLKMAEKEIKSMQKEMDNLNKEIENKKEEYENLKNSKLELANQVKELKETNNKLNSEYLNLCTNANTLKKTKMQLDKENREEKNKFNKVNNKLKDGQEKTEKIKQNLKNKEKEILMLKKEIEKLKQNNNFKDGTFFTSIGAKGKTKNDQLQDIDVNIDEELAEIEKKYNMLNEKEKLEGNNEKKNDDNKNKDLEFIQKEKSNRDDEKFIKDEDLKELLEKENRDDFKENEKKEKEEKVEKEENREKDDNKEIKEKEENKEKEGDKKKEENKEKEEKKEKVEKNEKIGENKEEEKKEKVEDNKEEEKKEEVEDKKEEEKNEKVEDKQEENKKEENKKKEVELKKEENKEKEVKIGENEKKSDESNSKEVISIRQKLIYNEEELKAQENNQDKNEQKEVGTNKYNKEEENKQKNNEEEKYENNDDFVDLDLNLDDDNEKENKK